MNSSRIIIIIYDSGTATVHGDSSSGDFGSTKIL